MKGIGDFKPKKPAKIYIVELIRMDVNTLVKRLSDDTIWYMDIQAPLNRRRWEDITE